MKNVKILLVALCLVSVSFAGNTAIESAEKAVNEYQLSSNFEKTEFYLLCYDLYTLRAANAVTNYDRIRMTAIASEYLTKAKGESVLLASK